MQEATALARLRTNVQPGVHPTLTEQELADLLVANALPDSNGNIPYSPGWVENWDIRAASRQGWLLKAAKAVPSVNFSGDGTQGSLSDIHEHCMAMANKYQSIGSINVGAFDR